MATGPVLPTDPLEILTPDLSRPEPYINKYWAGASTGGLFWACTLFSNYMLKRPVFSSVHYQAVALIGGGVVGQYFDGRRRDYYAEKDAVLRHYIQLHPDDFHATERKKFSEVLLPWNPIR